MRTALTRYVTPALMALGVILAIANWYLNSERSWAWAIPLAALVFLVVPLRTARRLQSSGKSAGWISNAVGLTAP